MTNKEIRRKVQNWINKANSYYTLTVKYTIYREGDYYVFEGSYIPDSWMNFIRVFLEFSPKSKIEVKEYLSEVEVRCIEMGISLLDYKAYLQVYMNQIRDDDSFSIDLVAEQSRYRMSKMEEPPLEGDQFLVNELLKEGYHYIAENVQKNVSERDIYKLSNAFSN